MTATTKSADLLIEGATVITMDAERRIFSDGAVAIGGGRITAVGQRREIAPTIQAERRIPGQGKVVIPGLINAHSHFFPFLSGAIPEEHPADIVRRDYLYPAFPIWMIIFNAPKAVFSCKIKVLASPCHHLARGPNG